LTNRDTWNSEVTVGLSKVLKPLWAMALNGEKKNPCVPQVNLSGGRYRRGGRRRTRGTPKGLGDVTYWGKKNDGGVWTFRFWGVFGGEDWFMGQCKNFNLTERKVVIQRLKKKIGWGCWGGPSKKVESSSRENHQRTETSG